MPPRAGALVALVFLAACAPPPQTPTPPQPYRSPAQVAAFKLSHPCPATGLPRGACPGWIVDHVIALACGGPDDPANMQWQTVPEAKAKDRWERIGCKAGRRVPA